MFIFSYLSGESLAVREIWWKALQPTDKFWALLSLLMNGFFAFFLNFSNFMTTKLTSALTVTIGGNVKHVATIVLSVLIFKNPISLINAFGTVVTSFGAAAYSFLSLDKEKLKIIVKKEGVTQV
eukprot:TRINITY_DN8750_c0_g1_i1.p1 TRINITY_DN8750_c0_g1~~TRINITY_DN8750_c0_g1_i1.p1  ORF type:complete len:124 (-),score=12.64 TRINITY_DN8750_c0_g1_i1:68-439(-)